jgi:catechol 2,3-dioxygenase-like lactoylglutathione lyase family enzyme
MTPSRERATVLDAVPVFRVASVRRSAAWYSGALGFAADAVGPPDDPVFAILRRDGVELMLQKVAPGIAGPRAAAPGGAGWDAYIRVDRADAAREAIRSNWPDVGPIEERAYGCREFTVTDPDGHALVFGECG